MIVVAHVEEELRPAPGAHARTQLDLGHRVPMEAVLVGRAAVWCHDVLHGDIERAIAWCRTMGPRACVLDVPAETELATVRALVQGTIFPPKMPAKWAMLHFSEK